jgi:hypothetical protein
VVDGSARRRWRRAIGTAAVLLVLQGMSACSGDGGPGGTTASSAPTSSSTDRVTGPGSTSSSTTTIVVATEPTQFTSPSGNIGCALGPAGFARCHIDEADWQPPPKPADCQASWGKDLAVTAGSTAEFVCTSDSVWGAPDVLAYGHAVDSGIVRCTSLETGVTCIVSDGHGFTLSRERYELF